MLGTDTISGTIVTDGTLGASSAADIIGGTFSFTDPQGDVYAGPALFNGARFDLEATPTQLLLDPGADSYLSIYSLQAVGGLTLTADAVYGNNPGNGYYYGEVEFNSGSLGGTGYVFESYPVPTSPSGSIGANSSWVIATVPEPTSLALFSLAILGLGGVYLRWPFIRKTTTRNRTAASSHRSRSLACESLEVRAMLSVTLPPTGYQAAPILNYGGASGSGYRGQTETLYYNNLPATGRRDTLRLCPALHASIFPTPCITSPVAATAARRSFKTTPTATLSLPTCTPSSPCRCPTVCLCPHGQSFSFVGPHAAGELVAFHATALVVLRTVFPLQAPQAGPRVPGPLQGQADRRRELPVGGLAATSISIP